MWAESPNGHISWCSSGVKGSEGSLGVNVGYWELLLAVYLENMDKHYLLPKNRHFICIKDSKLGGTFQVLNSKSVDIDRSG